MQFLYIPFDIMYIIWYNACRYQVALCIYEVLHDLGLGVFEGKMYLLRNEAEVSYISIVSMLDNLWKASIYIG